MKNLFISILIISLVACSKNSANEDNGLSSSYEKITYDTVPIDSFGPGATAVGVMNKINRVAEKRKADSLAKLAQAEKEKLEKEKLEQEKKAEAARQAKEKKNETLPLETPSTENTNLTTP